MAGSQGHNAKPGKQGFQRTFPEASEAPEVLDIPPRELSRTDKFFDDIAREEFEEKKNVGHWVGYTAVGAGTLVATTAVYLPAGGSPVIAGIVSLISIGVMSCAMRTMIADTKRWNKK